MDPSAGDARIFPVESVRSRFIADPVALRIPERPGLQAHYFETGPGQPLQQNAPCRSNADNHVVHFVIRFEAPHLRIKMLHWAETMSSVWLGLKKSEQRALHFTPSFRAQTLCMRHVL